MNRRSILTFLALTVMILGNTAAFSQLRQYKHMPDFDYADYDMHLKFMNQPFALVGQTLYLQDVSDTNLRDYFFIGSIAVPEKEDRTGVQYYKLKRMPEEQIQRLKGEWFVVADYVADQFAFNKIY
ncbi:MAG: hypothetical protein U0M28_00600 [Bacteroidales bacterium]|nr:hypothetical protein [Bacteroidales bacterium]